MLASDQKLTVSGLSPTARSILAMRGAVLADWEENMRRLVAGAAQMSSTVLIDTLPAFYDNMAEAVSAEHPRENATSDNDVASAHGSIRARLTTFGPDQLAQEYQLFREAFARVAVREGTNLAPAEWMIVHASIDLAMREALAAFSSMHDDFRHQLAASIAHDMRNPLSTLMGSAQLLSRTKDQARAQHLNASILDSGKRLGIMIERTLDALSYHGGLRIPLDLSEFDMLELVDDIVANGREEERDKTSVVGGPIRGYWCKDSLTRCIENLLANAFKYGDGNGARVKLDQAHGRLFLSVHNEGAPIAPENQPNVFQYLWRAKETSALKGWGIGLPFVKSVAESHGGAVSVDSSAARGTTFMIDLPLDCRQFVDAG